MKRFYLTVIKEENRSHIARLIRALLYLSSLAYGRLLSLRGVLYRLGIFHTERLQVPVISVGNLTWGGTGKTPFVLELSRKVQSLGKKPLVLSRGYGSDEWKELSLNLPAVPMGVGKNRAEVARQFLRRETVDAIIADDAFQHQGLYRDWDIVLINAACPFGNGFLIPRGSLREPLEAFGRAHTIVLTHVDRVEKSALDELKAQILNYAPHAEWVEAIHEPQCFYRASSKEVRSADSFRGTDVALISAIGSPLLFAQTVRSLGIEVKKAFEFPDHYHFRRGDLEGIQAWIRKAKVQAVITSEKDFFRNPELWIRLVDPWILKIRMRLIGGESVLLNRLSSLLQLSIVGETAYA